MRIIDCWVVFCVAVLLNAALIYASPQKGVDECRRSISQSSAQHSSSMFFSGSPWIFTKTMPIASHSQVSFSPLVFQCRELSLGHFFRAVPGRPPALKVRTFFAVEDHLQRFLQLISTSGRNWPLMGRVSTVRIFLYWRDLKKTYIYISVFIIHVYHICIHAYIHIHIQEIYIYDILDIHNIMIYIHKYTYIYNMYNYTHIQRNSNRTRTDHEAAQSALVPM